MADRASDDIDPVAKPPFRIEPGSRVVTAGSCFAQHVTRYLSRHGHPCMETEPAHPLLPRALAESFNYGIYSARYGNIYTARQLLQMWRRAIGTFVPIDDLWADEQGWFDPFRPTIQPGGFTSAREYEADRCQHFAAVRKAFTEMDVFIFTLGLTECWVSREDGAAYPLCPGVAAGHFDAERHVLRNFSVADVLGDLSAFFEEVRQINPRMRMIVTVSPVPLAATAEPRHVLTANTYSKAVLRVAAEQFCKFPDTYYFPAFEIVGIDARENFAADRRSLLEDGVRRVMALFARHLLAMVPAPAVTRVPDKFLDQTREIADACCDEKQLDASVTADSQDPRWRQPP